MPEIFTDIESDYLKKVDAAQRKKRFLSAMDFFKIAKEIIIMQYDKQNLALAVLADVKCQLDVTGHSISDGDVSQALSDLAGVLGSLKTVAGILQLPELQETASE